MSVRILSSALASLAILVGAACSSTSSPAKAGPAPACQANSACPQGTTCWPTSQTTFGCIASDPTAGFGAPCTERINQATCADGMLCDSAVDSGAGSCTSYCTSDSVCPAGFACRNTTAGTTSVNICRPASGNPPPAQDAGTVIIDDGGDSFDVYLGPLDAALSPDASGSVQ